MPRQRGLMRRSMWPRDQKIDTDTSVWTTVWCKQEMYKEQKLALLFVCRSQPCARLWRTGITNLTDLRGDIYIRALWPIRPILRCFKSFAQLTLVQPSQSQCSVFILYRNSPRCSFRCQCLKNETTQKKLLEGQLQRSLRREGILTPQRKRQLLICLYKLQSAFW